MNNKMELFQTKMGQQFYTRDFPEFVRELKKLNVKIKKNKIEDTSLL